MSGTLWPVLTTLVALAATYILTFLYRWRIAKLAHLPRPPPSLLWGHLKVFHEYMIQGNLDRHPDYILGDMMKDVGNSSIMLFDTWPVIGEQMIIVGSHDIAERISRASNEQPTSTRKAESILTLTDLFGAKSLLVKHGEPWKQIRKRFNPGFAPQHLMTLLPVITDKAMRFLEILDDHAEKGDIISFHDLVTNLTFDIIGKVTMGEDFSAQETPAGPIVVSFKQLLKLYTDDKMSWPWWMIPRKWWRRRQLGIRISHQLAAVVRRNFENTDRTSTDTDSRSVLALSLQGVEELTDDMVEETCDQLKTFLFAGHDTTSIAISWVIYELSRTPRVLKAVRKEIRELLGEDARDSEKMRQQLIGPGGDEILRRMTYISAVFKEALRLHPPAGTVRVIEPGSGFVVPTPQGTYNLDGTWVYLCQHLIHRDPAVYGSNANDFVPERWLQNDNLPPSAWRPFERGPRNCIGQELANIEARVIIAMVVQRYDFDKVGLGQIKLDDQGKPLVNDAGQYETESEVYASIQITARAVDGMMGRMRFASSPVNGVAG